jgi:Uma2 family endonuclease
MLDHHARLVPLTVEQYDRMLETGTLAEGAPIELLDGFLVLKDRSDRGGDFMTIGDKHFLAVNLMQEALTGVRRLGCFLTIQQPIRLPPSNVPEPDGAVVLGNPLDYRRPPAGSEVVCVIEVADSSLDHDLTTKLAIYARAAIPQYLVINLVDRTVIEHRHPSPSDGAYAPPQTYRPGETLTVQTPNGPFLVNVADLLA